MQHHTKTSTTLTQQNEHMYTGVITKLGNSELIFEET